VSAAVAHLLRPVRPRAAYWCLSNAMACPGGHAVKQNALALTDLVFWCKHRDPATGRECGAVMYVLVGAAFRDLLPAAEREGDAERHPPRLVFVAEVTLAEMRELERRGLSVWETLDYLGVAMRPHRRP
jgi:hypothetical protein